MPIETHPQVIPDLLGPLLSVPVMTGLAGVCLLLVVVSEIRRRRLVVQTRELSQQVEERERMLRNSARELAVLFDHAAIAVLVLDKQSRQAAYANGLALEAFGSRTLADLNTGVLFKPDAWSGAPFDLATFESHLHQAGEVGFVQCEWYFPGAPPYARWQKLTINHLVYDGKPSFLLTGINTTERKQIEAKRERRNRVLTAMAGRQALPQSLSQVIAMVEAQFADCVCGIMLANEDGTSLHWASAPRIPAIFRQATDGLRIQFGQAACGTAASLGSRVVSRAINQDPRWAGFLSVAQEAGFQACWSEPIFSASGQVLGTFSIYHPTPWEPGENDINTMTEPLYLASLALEDASTREQLQRGVVQEQLLRQLSTTLLQDGSNEDGIQRVLETVGRFFQLACGAVYLQDDAEPSLRPTHLWSSSAASPAPESKVVDLPQLQSLKDILHQKGYYLLEASRHETDSPFQALAGSPHARTSVILPIYRDHSIQGILSFDSVDSGAAWNISSLNTLQVIASFISHTLNRQALLASLEFKALHDQLTGLFNRHKVETTLQQEIVRAERYGNSLSVVLLDIDHFKEVNDTYGHGAGDDVLQQMAKTLQGEIRAADMSGRWGGEEFLILLPETDLSGASSVAEQLRRTVAEQAFPIDRPVTISLGIASYCPGDTPDSLVNRADEGLYRAKDKGRNCVQAVHSPRENSDDELAYWQETPGASRSDRPDWTAMLGPDSDGPGGRR